jgi:hypothetical protein
MQYGKNMHLASVRPVISSPALSRKFFIRCISPSPDCFFSKIDMCMVKTYDLSNLRVFFLFFSDWRIYKRVFSEVECLNSSTEKTV